MLPSEDLAAYQRHAQGLFDDVQPKGALEEQLVQSLADTTWRLNRVAALENNLLTLGMTEHADGINTAHPEAHSALAMAAALREQTSALASLSTHEHRLSRQFERTLNQLREIQAERRERDENLLRKAAELMQMDKAKGLACNPTEDGFVFSNDEIKTYIRRQDRRHKAYEASSKHFHAA